VPRRQRQSNPEFGAPNLTDKIWLYGSDEAAIIETITNGRAGVMPGWEGRLDPATIRPRPSTSTRSVAEITTAMMTVRTRARRNLKFI